MLDLGLQFYPLFICLEYGTRSIYAAIIGLLYTIALFGLYVAVVVSCGRVAVFAIFMLPIYNSLIFLGVRFCRNIKACIQRKETAKKQSDGSFSLGKRYQEYVYALLFLRKETKEAKEENTSRMQRFVRYFKQMATCMNADFIHRFPKWLISILFVELVFMYQWLMPTLAGFYYYIIFKSFITTKTFWNDTVPNVLFASFFFGTICAFLGTLLHMGSLLSKHRKHSRRLLAGDHSFIRDKCWNMSPAEILARNVMFPGMQVAHLHFGFFLIFLGIFLPCVILFFVIALAVHSSAAPKFMEQMFLMFARTFLPTVLMAIFVHFGLFFFVRIFLQQEVTEQNGKTKTRRILALTNWRAYQNLSYFMFLFYFIIGFFSILYRIMVSAFVGMIFVSRIDKSLLIRGMEHFDKAHLCYISLLRFELSHCNPVAVTFCQMLQKSDDDAKSNRHQERNPQQLSVLEEGEGLVGRGAPSPPNLPRRRWHKLYTLARNPQLAATTKYSLQQNKKEEEEEEVQ